MTLNQGRDDPGGILAEVYDDAEPALGVKMSAIKAFSTGQGVGLMEVWLGDGRQDRLDMIK